MRFPPIGKVCLSLLGLFVLLSQMPLMALADAPNYTTDFETWQIGTVQGHITKRILGYFDTQTNEINLTNKKGNSTPGTHYGQILMRPAIGLQVTKGWSLWQGYGWTPNFQPQFRNENQIWEQALYQHRFKHLAFSNRTRLEMRWIDHQNGQTSVRARDQVRVAVPLGKTRWSLVAFDEVFWNLNTVPNGPRQGFNQNWAFLGLERTLRTGVNLDVGYLNNYVRNFRPVPDRMNNVIFVSLNINMPGTGFDLHKQNPTQAPASSKTSMLPTQPMTAGQAVEGQTDAALLPSAQPSLDIAPITPAVEGDVKSANAENAVLDGAVQPAKADNLSPAEAKPQSTLVKMVEITAPSAKTR